MNSKKQYGLPRTNILKKKKDIQKVLEHGNRIPGRVFNTFVHKTGKTKVAFLTNKRIGKAVRRVRMKRLMREAFRLNKKKFEGMEVVFNIKTFRNDFHYLKKQVDNLLKR